MAFARGREAPGPYDVVLNNIHIMCLRLDDHGQPSIDGKIQWHAERLPYSPGTSTPEGAPYFVEPSMEQPEGFYAFSSGMGLRVQDPKRDRDTDGYYHGHWIDGAGDLVFNAPALTNVTPSTTDAVAGVNGIFTATIAGSRSVMALIGRYCMQRTADTAAGWANISKDFGAGTNAIKAEAYRGTQTKIYQFIAVLPPSTAIPLMPSLSTVSSGGTVADGVYTIEVTYTFANGESLPSPLNTITTAGGNVSTLTITSPAAMAGATGWYAYVSQVGGTTLTRQQAAGSPTAIGANLTLTAPPTNTGAGPVLNNFWAWDQTTATTTWTQHATLNALDFKVYRDQLWMLNRDANGAYQVQFCLDGGTAPTFSGAFIMADASNQCTNFEIHDDRLYVRSQKGLLAVSSGQTTSEVITGGEFSFVDLAPNNCRMVDFLQWLLVPMYRSYYTFQTDGTVEEIGLTSLRRNDSPVNGIPTAACAYGTWYVLVAFWNEATSTWYLMKWGNWKVYSTLFSPIPRRVFVPSWIGALAEGSSQIQTIGISEAAGGPYAYLGHADGTLTIYKLPRISPDATADLTWVKFNTTNPFQLYCPAITRGNPGVSKAVTGIEITGQNLNAAVTYRTGRAGAYGGGGNMQNGGVFTSDPGSRNNFTASVLTRWLDVLVTGTATDSITPCIVETVVAYLIPRPPFKFVFTFKMLIGDRIRNKNNNPIKEYDTVGWLNAITALCETGPITVVTPEGNSFLAVITDFKLDAAYEDLKAKDIEYIGTVQMMQHISITTQGEHSHLQAYSHLYLGAYTHSALGQL